MTDEAKPDQPTPDEATTDAQPDAARPDDAGTSEVIDTAAEGEKLSRRERRAAEKGKTNDGEPKDRNARVRAGVPSRRKTRERERAEAAARGLATTERVDDVFARSAESTSRFFRSQFAWLQWLILAVFAGLVALLIYNYRQGRQREKAGELLAQVLSVAQGRITTTEPAQPSDRNLVDTRPEFPSVDARSEAALKAWKGLNETSSGELAAYAELGRAATLLDGKKWSDARAAFEKAAAIPGISTEGALRAREGVGLALEAEGKLPEARAAFEKVKDTGAAQAKELSRFHVARVRFLQGEKDAARDELVKLRGELDKGKSAMSDRNYLSLAVEDLLKTVDPTAARETGGISPDQLEDLKRQLEQMQKSGLPSMPGAPGGPGIPGVPGAPSDQPAGPTP
ncbi:MAG TPA: hypothetical protein VLC09_02240 [Polyangiaceae bacterium]|nr:hypothetical protein [Polyangiaceae bacterium]